jgi:tetratricopeptide (TPR) repeat protein
MAGRRVAWVGVEVVVTVGLAGLLTNVASSQLPGWVSRPWLVFPALGVVLAGMVTLTVRRPAVGDSATSAPIWNAPARNPHFIGRDADLRRLRTLLQGRRSPVVVHAVRGMGGVGKTHLVLEYVHRHADDHTLIWWVAAEDAVLVPAQLGQLATALGLSVPSEDTEAVTAAVIAELHRRDRWLLVFDNAESVDAIRRFLPSGTGRVVITSRRGGFDALGTVLNLDVLPRADAVGFLRIRLRSMTVEQASELAELVGDLPLALEQATSFLIQTHTPVSDYLAAIRHHVEAMLTRGRDHHQEAREAQTVATLWNLSFAKIQQACPAAAQLLLLCGYLGADGIPLDLFTRNPDALPKSLTGIADDPLEAPGIAGTLFDYSLARHADDGIIVVHRLVQAAVRHYVSTQLDADNARSEPHPLTVVIRLLRVDLPDDIRRRPEAWPRWRQLLPHVLAVVRRERSPSDPAVDDTWWLLDRAATFLREHGQATDAVSLFERAIALAEDAHGPSHPAIATSLNGLAGALRDLGRPAEAVPLFQRALAISEAVSNPDHPDCAVSLNGLAVSVLDLGRAADAKGLFERALAIDEASRGPDHLAVAHRLMGLGTALTKLGKPADAIPLFQRALAITEMVHGVHHPDVSHSLNNLAGPLRALDRFEEANPLLQRAVAIDEATYGPNHPAVALSLNNFAANLRNLGNIAASIPLLERAVAIDERAYGANHPIIASRLDNLALGLLELERPADALPLLERALAITEGAYGPDHPDVAVRLNNLALALDHLDATADTKPLYQRALAIAEATHGPNHPDVHLYRRNAGLA